jgi:hypothetical protein
MLCSVLSYVGDIIHYFDNSRGTTNIVTSLQS